MNKLAVMFPGVGYNMDCPLLYYVTYIGGGAFSGCPIESIRIPDSVTSMGNHVFVECSDLNSIIVKGGSYAEQWARDNGYGDILVIE